MSSTGEHHRKAAFIGRSDHLLITHGTARLHDGRGAHWLSATREQPLFA